MTDPTFTAESERDDTAARLRLVGELDMVTAPHVADALEREFRTGVTGLVIDLGGVRFIDSSGLRALLLAADACRDREVELRLCVPPGPVARLLELAGVSEWFSYA